MDLVRSVTKRVKRTDATEDRSGYSRKQISMPVALLSTTNPLTNVCDLADAQKRRNEGEGSTPSTPTRSSLDGDSSVSSPSLASTPATSIGEPSPDCEYPSGMLSFADKTISLDTLENIAFDAPPSIPKRALSHSKRAHEQLARKRSVQFSRPSSDQSQKGTTASGGSIIGSGRDALKAADTGDASTLDPFSRELEQLSEIAEQFGAAARGAAVQDDLEVLSTRGLLKFDAKEYVSEIQFLWDAAFCDESPEHDNLWI